MFTLVFNEELSNRTRLIKIIHITHYIFMTPLTIFNILNSRTNMQKQEDFCLSSVRWALWKFPTAWLTLGSVTSGPVNTRVCHQSLINCKTVNLQKQSNSRRKKSEHSCMQRDVYTISLPIFYWASSQSTFLKT